MEDPGSQEILLEFILLICFDIVECPFSRQLKCQWYR